MFTGPLSKKNRDELNDLAAALSLTFDGKDIKSTLTEAIKNHFTAHPELQEDVRFCGMFQGRGRKHTAGVAELDKGREVEDGHAHLRPRIGTLSMWPSLLLSCLCIRNWATRRPGNKSI